jgi:hypothetical protein
MVYALILTTFMYGTFSKSPMAVTQTSTIGFTTQQACINAGQVAKAGTPNIGSSEQSVIITYQCAPLSV